MKVVTILQKQVGAAYLPSIYRSTVTTIIYEATRIDFTSVSTFSVSEMSSPVTKTPGKGLHHSPGKMSTLMTIEFPVPLFSAQWVMPFPPELLSPAFTSLVLPSSECIVTVPCRTCMT